MQVKSHLKINMFRTYENLIAQQADSFNTIYGIINKLFMLILQYFVYLCIITITLIKRFGSLLNNFHACPVISLSE